MSDEYLLDGTHPDNPLNPKYSEYDEERIQLKLSQINTDFPKVYCIGDCLTIGIGTSDCCNYPKYLQQIITDHEVVNLGRTMLRMDLLLTYQNITIPESNGNDIACVWCGTNDLFLGAHPNQVFENFYKYCEILWEKDIKIIPLTALPRPDYHLITGYETRRQDYNQLIRDNLENVADVGKDKRIGMADSRFDRNYYNDDQVHLTENGYHIVAIMVAEAIKNLYG